MNPAKKGSDSMTAEERSRASPTAYALRPDRLRPRSEGTQPSRRAASTMRPRVASDPPGRPFSAADTDEMDTPASAATSRMVTLGLIATPPPTTGRAPNLHPPPSGDSDDHQRDR